MELTTFEHDFYATITDWIIDEKRMGNDDMVCISMDNLEKIRPAVIRSICEDFRVSSYIDNISYRIIFYWGKARKAYRKISKEDCKDLLDRLF